MAGRGEDRDSKWVQRDLKSKTWGEVEVVRGVRQRIHSNGSHSGAARGLGPHPHLRYLRVGGNRADEMLPSLSPPLVCQEVGVQETEGGRPSSLPSQPLLKCGEGEPPPLFQRGAQREQVTCPKQVAQ